MNINSMAQSLGYTKAIKSNDQMGYADLIYWVESNIIQQKNTTEREFLKDGKSKNWTEHLCNYATSLNCPQSVTNTDGLIDYILNAAIKKKYLAKGDVYNKYSIDNLKSSNVPNVEVDNVLDHINFSSEEFRAGINKIAKILNLPPHSDPFIVLKACTVLINRLNKDALEKPEDYIVSGMPFPYKQADPGFKVTDDAVKEAAKVLRLLYISDLRSLQTKINECIVAVQSVTANPKTDTKLGKVGI